MAEYLQLVHGEERAELGQHEEDRAQDEEHGEVAHVGADGIDGCHGGGRWRVSRIVQGILVECVVRGTVGIAVRVKVAGAVCTRFGYLV